MYKNVRTLSFISKQITVQIFSKDFSSKKKKSLFSDFYIRILNFKSTL